MTSNELADLVERYVTSTHVGEPEQISACFRALEKRLTYLEEADTILRWIEAGFPPWGCHNCRGAEYGPDGIPCTACGGKSHEIEPPERAQKIEDYFDEMIAGNVLSAVLEERRRQWELDHPNYGTGDILS